MVQISMSTTLSTDLSTGGPSHEIFKTFCYFYSWFFSPPFCALPESCFNSKLVVPISRVHVGAHLNVFEKNPHTEFGGYSKNPVLLRPSTYFFVRFYILIG